MFVLRESRVAHPLMPLRLFSLRNVAVSQVVGILWAGAMFACFFLTALYMQGVLGYGALEVGLAYLPTCVVMAVCSLKFQRQAGHEVRHPPAADRRARPGRPASLALFSTGFRSTAATSRTCFPAWCCSASAPASPSTRCCSRRWATWSPTRPAWPPGWSTPAS